MVRFMKIMENNEKKYFLSLYRVAIFPITFQEKKIENCFDKCIT